MVSKSSASTNSYPCGYNHSPSHDAYAKTAYCDTKATNSDANSAAAHTDANADSCAITDPNLDASASYSNADTAHNSSL